MWLLTYVFNLILNNFSYFNINNITLKYLITLITYFIPVIAINAQQYGNIEFIENKGQWNNKVKFKGNVSGGALFIRSAGITILQHNKEDLNTIYSLLHNHYQNGVFIIIINIICNIIAYNLWAYDCQNTIIYNFLNRISICQEKLKEAIKRCKK